MEKNCESNHNTINRRASRIKHALYSWIHIILFIYSEYLKYFPLFRKFPPYLWDFFSNTKRSIWRLQNSHQLSKQTTQTWTEERWEKNKENSCWNCVIIFKCDFQKQKDFWQDYQKFFGEKLPPCFVSLLRESGYNLMSTLSGFRTNDIAGIEDRLKYLIQSFKCCNANTYQRQEIFQFLPAHRNLLVNMPEIQLMKQ